MPKQGSISNPAARIFNKALSSCLSQAASTTRSSRSNNEARPGDFKKKRVLGSDRQISPVVNPAKVREVFQNDLHKMEDNGTFVKRCSPKEIPCITKQKGNCAVQSHVSDSNMVTVEQNNTQDSSNHKPARNYKSVISLINNHLSVGNDCSSKKPTLKRSASDSPGDSQESKVSRTNQSKGTTFMSERRTDILQPEASGTLLKQKSPHKVTYTDIQKGNFTARSLVGSSSSAQHPKRRIKSLISMINNHLSSDGDSSNRKPALKRPASDCLDDSFKYEGTSNQSTVLICERGNDTALLTVQSKDEFSAPESTSNSTSARNDQDLLQPELKKKSRDRFSPSDSFGNSSRTIVLKSTKSPFCTPVSRFSYNNSDKPAHQRSTYSVDSKRSAADITPFSPVTRSPESLPVRRLEIARTGALIPSYELKGVSWKSPVSIIDSHCHLDFLFTRENYHNSYASYRSKHSGSFPDCYEGCITIFCEPQSFFRKHEWDSLLQEDGVWAGFGCHPHMAEHYSDEAEDALIKTLDDPKVIALGEIGLDYSKRNNCDRGLQKKVLRRQLSIGLDHNKPLIIHCREAHGDCIEILKEMVPRNYPIHLHCFTDTWQRATEWMTEFPNLFIGITNVITFPSAENVHKVARNIPIDRLLFETDTPYFVPKSLSRRSSHPGLVIHVAAQIAAFREDIQLEDLLRTVRNNTNKVYGI